MCNRNVQGKDVINVWSFTFTVQDTSRFYLSLLKLRKKPATYKHDDGNFVHSTYIKAQRNPKHAEESACLTQSVPSYFSSPASQLFQVVSEALCVSSMFLKHCVSLHVARE